MSDDVRVCVIGVVMCMDDVLIAVGIVTEGWRDGVWK